MKSARIDGAFGVRRLVAAFRSFALDEEQRQVAALQTLAPFQVVDCIQL
jgi:hypothetical protein